MIISTRLLIKTDNTTNDKFSLSSQTLSWGIIIDSILLAFHYSHKSTSMRTIIIPQNFWRQTKSNYLLYLVIQNVECSLKLDIQHALFVMIDFSKIIGLTY